MTITQKIIGVAFGLFFVLGSVYAAPVTCGAVTGALRVFPPSPGVDDIKDISGTPISCSESPTPPTTTFSWDGNDGFNVTAALANIGTSNMTIELTMFTGDRDNSGFTDEAYWSFTLNGFTFLSIVEGLDSFVPFPGVTFESQDSTAIFTISAPPENGYPEGTTYTASYIVSSEQVNGVPEPGTWHLVLSSLGVLALTGRRSRSTRRRLAD